MERDQGRHQDQGAGVPPRRPPIVSTATGHTHLLDRMVRNIRTGHFERALSALTAVGSVVTAGEIYFEHDRASFGNRMMWLPVALGPLGFVSGVAGVFSKPAAKTLL